MNNEDSVTAGSASELPHVPPPGLSISTTEQKNEDNPLAVVSS